MKQTTEKESEAILRLVKDINTDYNANSISKKIRTSRRGALNILKKLKSQNITTGKTLGKATFYRINLDDYLTFRTAEILLIREARGKVSRWINELKDVNAEISIIFGSAIRDEKKAKDIDILFAIKKENYEEVRQSIEEKNKILIKPIHAIILSIEDFRKNLKDEVILNAISGGYVLIGHELLLKEIKNVTRR